MRSILLVLLLWLVPSAMAAVGPSSPELRDLLNQITNSPDVSVRVAAADRLARELTQMEEDTVRRLRGVLIYDGGDCRVRCAVANIFASYAARRKRARHNKIMRSLIAALQDAQRTSDPQVRLCIINACVEFNDDAVLPILEYFAGLGEPPASAARDAIRRRQNRIRDEGN